MMATQFGQFDRQSAERIAAVVRRVEGTQRNNPNGNRGGAIFSKPHLARVEDDDTGTGTDVVTGSPITVTLLDIIGNEKTDATGEPITVEALNDKGATFSDGDTVYIFFIAGEWRIVSEASTRVTAIDVDEGVLEEPITAPANIFEPPTATLVRRAIRDEDQPDGTPGGLSLVSGELGLQTVYNSDPDLTGPAGAYCRFGTVSSGSTAILQFFYVGCTDATAGTGS